MSESPDYPSPEEEGIPDYADDTSTAYQEGERPRFRDSPASMPADEPHGVDEYGVTAAEQRHGEPLDMELAREEPDVTGAPERPRPAGAGAEEDYGTLEPGGAAGRLLEPDQGAGMDEEKELQARPTGGEALSAEEAAVHELSADEQREPPEDELPG